MADRSMCHRLLLLLVRTVPQGYRCRIPMCHLVRATQERSMKWCICRIASNDFRMLDRFLSLSFPPLSSLALLQIISWRKAKWRLYSVPMSDDAMQNPFWKNFDRKLVPSPQLILKKKKAMMSDVEDKTLACLLLHHDCRILKNLAS